MNYGTARRHYVYNSHAHIKTVFSKRVVSKCRSAYIFEFWHSEQVRHTVIPLHTREGTTSVLTAEVGGEGHAEKEGECSNANTKQLAPQPVFGLPAIKKREAIFD